MGYVIAYRLAAENLRLGASVVADCVCGWSDAYEAVVSIKVCVQPEF
ncbi:MAG: hypothetical protein JO313_11600 [Verrucomicrobia bacterium]|nr:hypothetical protein [Verrucomicrobiota bacterium]